MSRQRRSKSTWLFAFTDLSFLLLISLSMIPATTAGDLSLRLAQMRLPTVPDSRTLDPLAVADEAWELRILSPEADDGRPFRLVRSGEQTGTDCDEASLMPALDSLRQREIKPLLLPDKASRTQDFLFAAGALARVWSATQSEVIVQPVPTGGSE